MSPIAHWRNSLRDSSLDRTAKLVGFVLSTYMSAGGVAWPSKITLAHGASLGREDQKGNTAVDEAIDRLEAAGLLIVERRRGRRGFLYTAVIPRGCEGLTGSESLAGTGDNDLGIPRGTGAKSLADLPEIPRRGEGEIEESENQSGGGQPDSAVAPPATARPKPLTANEIAQLEQSTYSPPAPILAALRGSLLQTVDDEIAPRRAGQGDPLDPAHARDPYPARSGASLRIRTSRPATTEADDV